MPVSPFFLFGAILQLFLTCCRIAAYDENTRLQKRHFFLGKSGSASTPAGKSPGSMIGAHGVLRASWRRNSEGTLNFFAHLPQTFAMMGV